MKIIETIANSSFFKGLSEDNLSLLESLSQFKEIPGKSILFHEEDQGECFYLLGKGKIQLSKSTPDGKQVIIKILLPGEVFGEVVLFEKDTYPVTAQALTHSGVFAFPRVRFLELLEKEFFRNDFLRLLLQKQRYLADRILFLTAHDAETRFFIFVKTQLGVRSFYTLPFSKKEMAEAIGITPETFSRLLTRLVEEKKISFKGKTLFIHQWQGN